MHASGRKDGHRWGLEGEIVECMFKLTRTAPERLHAIYPAAFDNRKNCQATASRETPCKSPHLPAGVRARVGLAQQQQRGAKRKKTGGVPKYYEMDRLSVRP